MPAVHLLSVSPSTNMLRRVRRADSMMLSNKTVRSGAAVYGARAADKQQVPCLGEHSSCERTSSRRGACRSQQPCSLLLLRPTLTFWLASVGADLDKLKLSATCSTPVRAPSTSQTKQSLQNSVPLNRQSSLTVVARQSLPNRCALSLPVSRQKVAMHAGLFSLLAARTSGAGLRSGMVHVRF